MLAIVICKPKIPLLWFENVQKMSKNNSRAIWVKLKLISQNILLKYINYREVFIYLLSTFFHQMFNIFYRREFHINFKIFNHHILLNNCTTFKKNCDMFKLNKKVMSCQIKKLFLIELAPYDRTHPARR